MNIRLTPRGLNALKTLAAEAGMRPGELVTAWVEERLEAERTGIAAPEASGLIARIDELAARIAALESRTSVAPVAEPAAAEAEADASVAMPRRRGRPPKAVQPASGGAEADAGADAKPRRGRPRKTAAATPKGRRVPLHEEIIAVIGERGPQTAAELASAIIERGVFQAPRSGKPLDAATVNSRVSNPVYRSRFRRVGHQIALSEG